MFQYKLRKKQRHKASQSRSLRKEPLTTSITFLITSLNSSSSFYACTKADDLITLTKDKETKKPGTLLNHCILQPPGNGVISVKKKVPFGASDIGEGKGGV